MKLSLMERLDWWWFRRQLWWSYIRESGRMLNRRGTVENILLEVANGKREGLTQQDCYELAMYLGSPTRILPPLEAQRILKAKQ